MQPAHNHRHARAQRLWTRWSQATKCVPERESTRENSGQPIEREKVSSSLPHHLYPSPSHLPPKFPTAINTTRLSSRRLRDTEFYCPPRHIDEIFGDFESRRLIFPRRILPFQGEIAWHSPLPPDENPVPRRAKTPRKPFFVRTPRPTTTICLFGAAPEIDLPLR